MLVLVELYVIVDGVVCYCWSSYMLVSVELYVSVGGVVC